MNQLWLDHRNVCAQIRLELSESEICFIIRLRFLPKVGICTGLGTFTFHFHTLEKEMATHSSVLAWKIPGTGKPGRLPSMGSHRVRHDWSDLAAAATGTIPAISKGVWKTAHVPDKLAIPRNLYPFPRAPVTYLPLISKSSSTALSHWEEGV